MKDSELAVRPVLESDHGDKGSWHTWPTRRLSRKGTRLKDGQQLGMMIHEIPRTAFGGGDVTPEIRTM